MSPWPGARPGARQRRHLALVHPETAAVALVAAPGFGLALPFAEAAWDLPAAVPQPTPDREAGPPPHAVLACLAEAEDREAPAPGRVERLLWGEALPGTPLSPSAWWDVDDAPPTGLPAGLLDALRVAVAGFREPEEPAWPPFAARGATAAVAHALAEDTGAARLASLDPNARHALRQRRAWPISSVWSNDAAFVKLVPPRWASEGPVTAWLAELVPGLVPSVAAHGCASAPGGPVPWFVQRALPSGAFGDGVPERCAAAMGALVRVAHRELAAGRARGLDDRTPTAVAAGLAEVWASPELAGLDPSERDRLPELDARLRHRLAALDADGVTHVLVHGDLHGGNVLVGIDGPAGDAVIDWSDAAVGWPGVDLLTVLGLGAALDGVDAERAVAAFVDAAGPALGRGGAAIVRLGMRAAPAFHALSYARIEATTPPSQRWHLEGVVRHLVRRMLRDEGLA